MSGIAVILARDGSPIDRSLMERMTAVLARTNPDRHAVHLREQIALGHALLATTPEAAAEQQPLTLDGERWITADARIDNRAELLDTLRAHGRPIDTSATDPELILHAYRVWGDDCPRYLIGSFAFALWDEPRRRLLCARDPVGIRPLYYLVQPHQIILASTLGAILAALAARPALNRRYLHALLSGDDAAFYMETVYEGILPVLPTHRLLIDQTVTMTPYYHWDALADVRYKTDADYIAHFRTVYSQVLTDLSRSTTPVAVEVSGGLDSSSNAAMLKALEEAGRLGQVAIQPYSVYAGQFPQVNNRRYLDLIIERCQPWAFHLVNADTLWALKNRNHADLFDQPAIISTVDLELRAMQQAAERGSRVVLSGVGGDELLLGECYHVPELFALFPPGRWRSEWAAFGKIAGRKKTLYYGVAVAALNRLLPRRHVHQLIRQGQRRWSSLAMPPPDWVRPYPPGDRQDWDRFNSKFMFTQTQIRLLLEAILLNGSEQAALTQMGGLAAAAGVERRYPFLDRRLIDLAMAFPVDVMLREGQDRWVLRAAMREHLPEQIRHRPSSGTYQPLVDLGWRETEKAFIELLLSQSIVCEWGLVRQDRLHQAWQQYWANAVIPHKWALNAWLNLELWLREWQG
jgi:asparagine synthase (glutamine-hydrolysing)